VTKYNVGECLLAAFHKGVIMNIQSVELSLKTLGNANELVCAITQEILGNDVADTINNSPITRETIYAIAQSQFTARLGKIAS